MVHQTHHLNNQAHLCSITYMTLKVEKKNTKEQMYFHDGESMKLIYMNYLSKNYYPQGQSNTEKNCGRMIKPLICPRYIFFPKKGNKLIYPKTHKTKDRRQRQTCTRTQILTFYFCLNWRITMICERQKEQ